MRRIAWRSLTGVALAGLVLFGIWSDASAAPSAARPRPPTRVEPYKPIPHVPPENVHPTRDDLVRAAQSERSAAQAETPSAEARKHWEAVTQALGPETDTTKGAYVVIHIGRDGIAWMTTNLVRGSENDRKFFALTPAELRDSVRLEASLQGLLGDRSANANIMLKVLLDGSLAEEVTQKNAISALTMATNRFRFAELVEISGGRAYSLERVEREIGPPRWLSRLNTCCVYAGIPPDIASWRRLASVPFDRSHMQVVSLFPDYTAQQGLKGSGLNVVFTHPDQISGDVVEALRLVFASGPPGSPVVVIGHVSNGSFIIETGNGTAIPLSTVSEMAAKAGRPVYLMGCYTAEHYQVQSEQSQPTLGFPVTTLSVLQPRALVDRLVAASLNSKSLQDFTQLLSTESLYVHMPSGFLTTLPDQRRSLLARIASVTQDGARAVTAFFRVDLPCLFGGCP